MRGRWKSYINAMIWPKDNGASGKGEVCQQVHCFFLVSITAENTMNYDKCTKEVVVFVTMSIISTTKDLSF